MHKVVDPLEEEESLPRGVRVLVEGLDSEDPRRPLPYHRPHPPTTLGPESVPSPDPTTGDSFDPEPMSVP